MNTSVSHLMKYGLLRSGRRLANALRQSAELPSSLGVIPVANISYSCHLGASAKVRIMKTPLKLKPTRDPLTLTQKAVSRVKELLEGKPGVLGLRVSVRQRGCSGLTYTLDYVEAGKSESSRGISSDVPNDHLLGLATSRSSTAEKDIGRINRHETDVEVVHDGVRIFIDRRAQLTLLGTEMDYVETKLGAEFIFSNPNIKATCGCGESFMLS